MYFFALSHRMTDIAACLGCILHRLSNWFFMRRCHISRHTTPVEWRCEFGRDATRRFHLWRSLILGLKLCSALVSAALIYLFFLSQKQLLGESQRLSMIQDSFFAQSHESQISDHYPPARISKDDICAKLVATEKVSGRKEGAFISSFSFKPIDDTSASDFVEHR